MGRFIVKPDPDRDEYVEWSSSIESPIGIGSRADFLRELGPEAEVRLTRADRTGTSMIAPRVGVWGDSLVFDQRGSIACAKLSEFTHLLLDFNLQAALRLCEPFDGEDRVRGLLDPEKGGNVDHD